MSCNMFYFTGCHFLWDDMFYLRVCIIVRHVLRSSGFTGIHVLQGGILYWIIRLTGHLLYEDWFYWRVCIGGSHVSGVYVVVFSQSYIVCS